MGRINAGQLKERITFIIPSVGPGDGRGGNLPGPYTQTTVYARVRPLSGSEKLRLGQVVNDESYEITIRRLSTASPKQRVMWKGRTLNVLAVVPDEDSEYQVLTCTNGGESN